MVNFSYFCTFFKPKINQSIRVDENIYVPSETFQFAERLLERDFTADLMAGIIVGIVALPLAIAFGIASGVSPEKGIITAIIAGFVISLLGGSKVQIGGPTGAFIVIVYGIIARYGETGLIVATIMAGAILVMLGASRSWARSSNSSLPDRRRIHQRHRGYDLHHADQRPARTERGLRPGRFLPKWQCYFENIGTADPLSIVVGIGSIAIIALWPRISKKIPGSLVAIFAMTLLTYLLRRYAGVTSIETIGDRFQISASLPGVAVPDMSWDVIKGLFPAAVTIAVLGAIESLLSATVADGVTGDKHDSNQELIAQGAANIVTPLFGGIPATGAIARTMTNINNGGKTPVAGLIHAAVLLLILLCLGPLTRHIPMACLAGVLVIVAYNMSEWRTFRALMSNPKADVAVLLVTFLLTVLFDLTVAIEVGLVIACLLFMRRVAETTNISVLKDEIDPNADAGISLGAEHLVIPEGVEVYEIDGPFFFGIANKFEEQMVALGNHPQIRIIRMRKVPFIDSTGIHNLTNLCRMSKREGVQIILSGVNPTVHRTLEQARFYDLIGKENICSHIDLALEQARKELAARHPGKR